MISTWPARAAIAALSPSASRVLAKPAASAMTASSISVRPRSMPIRASCSMGAIRSVKTGCTGRPRGASDDDLQTAFCALSSRTLRSAASRELVAPLERLCLEVGDCKLASRSAPVPQHVGRAEPLATRHGPEERCEHRHVDLDAAARLFVTDHARRLCPPESASASTRFVAWNEGSRSRALPSELARRATAH